MACILKEEDIRWLIEKHSGLRYLAEYKALAGDFSFSAQYADCERINDHYKVAIFSNTAIDCPLPLVVEIDGRIKRMGLILGIDTADLHMNGDGTLCLVRPDKFRIWYPNGFDIMIFEHNLVTHFYWLSYRERHGVEPWKGEEHGGNFTY